MKKPKKPKHPKKHAPRVNLEMPFDEALKRISRVHPPKHPKK